MYRIEVAPGEETVFRTIEELAIGIRNGVITPRARIYHAASQKWLPIEFHPHYKKALEGPVPTTPHASKQPPKVPHFPTPTRVPAHPPAPAASSPPPEPASPPPPAAPAPPAPAPAPRQAATHSAAEPHSHTPPWVQTPRPHVVQQPTPKPVGQKPPMPQAIPAPVQSPVIAMQNSILRDLPVVSVPEPIRPPGTWPPILSAPIVHPPVATRHDAYSHAHESHLADDPAPLPTARRSRRKGGHPLMLVGAALLLVASTHFALNANLSGSASAEAPVAQPLVDEADDYSDTPPPVDDEAVDEKPAPAAPATEASPRVTVAPARVQMTPGPAFAASAPTRPQPDSAARARSLAATPAPRPAPLQAPASIEPAPAAMDLDLPVIPGSDSIASAVKSRDSLAMKRILRALNGAKPADAKATP